MSVTLHTNLGDIKIEVFCESVPKTAEVCDGSPTPPHYSPSPCPQSFCIMLELTFMIAPSCLIFHCLSLTLTDLLHRTSSPSAPPATTMAPSSTVSSQPS